MHTEVISNGSARVSVSATETCNCDKATTQKKRDAPFCDKNQLTEQQQQQKLWGKSPKTKSNGKGLVFDLTGADVLILQFLQISVSRRIAQLVVGFCS